MGSEFHVSPSINEAYYAVEDQRFLRAEGFGEKGCGERRTEESPMKRLSRELPGDWKYLRC
jgi:hypothetical protein